MDIDFTLKFDNIDLGTIDYFFPTSRLPNNMPDIDLKAIDLVRNDGAIVVSSRFKKKVIQVFGYILAPNRQAYEAAFDELKWRLSAKQRSLVLVQAGSERIYTATVSQVTESFVEGGKTYITMQFDCNDPYGRDGNKQSYTEAAFTTAVKAIAHTFLGYADILPKFTVTITAVSGGTSKTVNIGNSVTGQQISVTRTWVAGDVLVVDSDTQKVTVNGVVVDFAGFFPVFSPRTAYAQYSDNFTTSRTASVLVEYPKKYL
jgi:phage-related protein